MEYEDYQDFEKAQEEAIKQNKVYLDIFQKQLEEAGLAQKTIRNHIDNVANYLNYYLIYDEIDTMENGACMLDTFFTYFFPRKCLWASAASAKSTATSLKKFYKCMYEKGLIREAAYDILCSDIKMSMPEWQRICGR